MDSSLLDALLRGTQRRIFVSYHHDSDQSYYDAFSLVFTEAVRDNSLDRAVDSDDAEYVMRRIRENHISGSSCTIVLCGPQTRSRKYVDWEIKATLDKAHGLVGIKLPNNLPDSAGRVHKPDRLQDNIDSTYAIFESWENIINRRDYFRALIEVANGRPASLIVNERTLRRRNG